MRKQARQDEPTFDDEIKNHWQEGSLGESLLDEDRALLIKRLAFCGIPTREIVRITGASSRTVARTLQRLGIQRKNPERHSPSRKRYEQRLIEILTQYYALNEITLDSLDQIASENGLTLRKLMALIHEHVSPSRWAIRSCLACGQPALTSGPADRYCVKCKKRVKKAHGGLDE